MHKTTLVSSKEVIHQNSSEKIVQITLICLQLLFWQRGLNNSILIYCFHIEKLIEGSCSSRHSHKYIGSSLHTHHLLKYFFQISLNLVGRKDQIRFYLIIKRSFKISFISHFKVNRLLLLQHHWWSKNFASVFKSLTQLVQFNSMKIDAYRLD